LAEILEAEIHWSVYRKKEMITDDDCMGQAGGEVRYVRRSLVWTRRVTSPRDQG
jgi:hypothetical protein